MLISLYTLDGTVDSVLQQCMFHLMKKYNTLTRGQKQTGRQHLIYHVTENIMKKTKSNKVSYDGGKTIWPPPMTV